MKFNLQNVPKARNLDRIGWSNGYVLVQFKGRPDRYIFGPAITKETFDKLFTAAFPDRQFHLTIKNKFQCHKVGS